MSDVTVKDLQSKIDTWHMLKDQVKDLEDKISDINKSIAPIAREITEIMEALDITTFAGTRGKVQKRVVDYVSMPASDEARLAFNEYLKREGIFDDMVSIHHHRLNSFYNSKLQEAIDQGTELNIPGLEPKQRIELRKGR